MVVHTFRALPAHHQLYLLSFTQKKHPQILAKKMAVQCIFQEFAHFTSNPCVSPLQPVLRRFSHSLHQWPKPRWSSPSVAAGRNTGLGSLKRGETWDLNEELRRQWYIRAMHTRINQVCVYVLYVYIDTHSHINR